MVYHRALARHKRLLVLDSYSSYITIRFIDFCDANKILLAIYLPYSIHSLQPLNVSLFSPLSQAYSARLEHFMYEYQGISNIIKRDFFRLFWLSQNKAISTKKYQQWIEICWFATLGSRDCFSTLHQEGRGKALLQRVLAIYFEGRGLASY